jgi:hypothetical protein
MKLPGAKLIPIPLLLGIQCVSWIAWALSPFDLSGAFWLWLAMEGATVLWCVFYYKQYPRMAQSALLCAAVMPVLKLLMVSR